MILDGVMTVGDQHQVVAITGNGNAAFAEKAVQIGDDLAFVLQLFPLLSV